MAYPALLRIRPSRRLRDLADELWALQTLDWLGGKVLAVCYRLV